MDRHNMMLFLQNDTSKLCPAGFEVPRRNIFDPEDDPVYVPVQQELARPLESANGTSSVNSHGSKAENTSSLTGKHEQNEANHPGTKETNSNSTGCQSADEKRLDINRAEDDAPKGNKRRAAAACSRRGCARKPRFDSIFCSDSCGVSTLETDLLRTLQYAGKLHPSILRS